MSLAGQVNVAGWVRHGAQFGSKAVQCMTPFARASTPSCQPRQQFLD